MANIRKPTISGLEPFLTAALRRGIFLCVTPRRTLRNSAVKRTQTKLQPSKVFRIRPWCQARPADSGRCVSTPAGRFGDPRSASCTGSCHMKICLGQRSLYRKYGARCGWSGGYVTTKAQTDFIERFPDTSVLSAEEAVLYGKLSNVGRFSSAKLIKVKNLATSVNAGGNLHILLAEDEYQLEECQNLEFAPQTSRYSH